MKRKLILAATMLALITTRGEAIGAETGYLVQDGVPLGQIFAPESMRRASAFAVEELKEHIRAISDAEIEVMFRDPVRSDRGIILKVIPKEERPEGASAQKFNITQNAKAGTITITGNSHIAVLYGVYEYLASLGVRWYAPGEVGRDIPRMASIAIINENRDAEPIYRLRSLDLSGTIESHFGDAADPRVMANFDDYVTWLIRNRLHLRRHMLSERRTKYSFSRPPYIGGHSLLGVAGLREYHGTPGTTFEKSPERWPMVMRDFELVRTNTGPVQICFTNKDNVEDAIANVVRRLKFIRESDNELEEVASISLSLADCGGICRCPECDKVAGEGENRDDRLIWSFMNQVARGVDAQVPGGNIMLYSPYYDMTAPPADVRLEPNIIAISCRSVSWHANTGQKPGDPFAPAYRDWIERTKAAGASQGVYDYVLMARSPQPLDILDAFDEYRKLGYKYYHPEVMQRSEQSWPLLWSMAQASWGSDHTPRELVEIYCQGYYGEDGGKLVLNLLEKINENSRRIPRITYGCSYYASAMLPDDLIAVSREEIAKAIGATTGLRQERLRRFSHSIEVHFRIAEIFRANAEALNYRTPETIGALRTQVNDFIAFWENNHVGDLFTAKTLEQINDILKIDHAALKPKRGKTDFNDVETVLQWLFVDERAPVTAKDLFVLPEVWKLKLDSSATGTDGWQAVGLDDSAEQGWQDISSWNAIEPQGYGDVRQVDGFFWYRVRFTAPHYAAGKKITLRMGGLDDEGKIYLNGELIADQRSADGHAWNKAFNVDVTAVLKQGEENILAVHGFDGEGGAGVWLPTVLYAE